VDIATHKETMKQTKAQTTKFKAGKTLSPIT